MENVGFGDMLRWKGLGLWVLGMVMGMKMGMGIRASGEEGQGSPTEEEGYAARRTCRPIVEGWMIDLVDCSTRWSGR